MLRVPVAACSLFECPDAGERNGHADKAIRTCEGDCRRHTRTDPADTLGNELGISRGRARVRPRCPTHSPARAQVRDNRRLGRQRPRDRHHSRRRSVRHHRCCPSLPPTPQSAPDVMPALLSSARRRPTLSCSQGHANANATADVVDIPGNSHCTPMSCRGENPDLTPTCEWRTPLPALPVPPEPWSTTRHHTRWTTVT